MQLLHGYFTIVGLIGLAFVVLGAFTFVDAALRRPEAFAVAGKLTKGKWMAITGVATGALLLFRVMSFFGPVAIVAILVYLLDVRPAVRGMSGPRPPRQSSW